MVSPAIGEIQVKRFAIVTGAGRGIGEATARVLARDGLTVALADLNLSAACRVAETLSGDGHGAFQVDVADERSVEELFDVVESKLGVVAVLACVAGGPFLTPGRRLSIVETTTENWIRLLGGRHRDNRRLHHYACREAIAPWGGYRVAHFFEPFERTQCRSHLG
jgi:NAD(P)-dependent dehydrogenase (short-subunit alcohol dehydrogenase family)